MPFTIAPATKDGGKVHTAIKQNRQTYETFPGNVTVEVQVCTSKEQIKSLTL